MPTTYLVQLLRDKQARSVPFFVFPAAATRNRRTTPALLAVGRPPEWAPTAKKEVRRMLHIDDVGRGWLGGVGGGRPVSRGGNDIRKDSRAPFEREGL